MREGEGRYIPNKGMSAMFVISITDMHNNREVEVICNTSCLGFIKTVANPRQLLGATITR